MRIKKNKRIEDSEELQMTPMIDIVFQLLIFFLLSAKFIALEGQLNSYLPKDKGLDNTPQTLELVNVILDLRWVDAGDRGRVLCRTADYRAPDGSGTKKDVHVFGSIAPGQRVRYGAGQDAPLVEFETEVPDFAEIEYYLRYRHLNHEKKGTGKGLPVTVNFDNNVPTQMVVLLLDICTRVGIEDFTLNATEAPY